MSSSNRTWTAGTAVVSILLVLAAWFLLIGPKRGDAASLKQQRESQLAANNQLKLDIAQLKAQSASLPAKQAELAVIQRQLPNNPQLPTLIRSLSTIATQAGLQLTSIAPGAPTELASATTGSASASAGTTPSGVLSIPVTIVSTGTYAENELFLQKVQMSMTRALLVSGLSLAPAAPAGQSSSSTNSTAADGSSLALTITGSVFVLPTTPTPATTTSGTTGAAATATPAKTTGSAN
jgi:type IV pilus assembly protein PilO